VSETDFITITNSSDIVNDKLENIDRKIKINLTLNMQSITTSLYWDYGISHNIIQVKYVLVTRADIFKNILEHDLFKDQHRCSQCNTLS
jgi:hypothetical protein